MSRPPADERDGDNVMMLTCAHCGRTVDVWYKTCPPEYCSDACKQAAYRQRKKANEPVTKATPETVTGLMFDRKRWKRGCRLYNTVRTDTLEITIARYRALGRYEAAQAIYDLARSISAPIDEEIITAEAEKRRRFYEKW